MSNTTSRDKLLTEGVRLVHQNGYLGASVRDVVKAAEVAQGSFTGSFASKEAFGVEVLDLYYRQRHAFLDATLRNQALAPLDRLRSFIDVQIDRQQKSGMRYGCMLGNMGAEVTMHSEPIRHRLAEIYGEMQLAIEECLRAAGDAGQVLPGMQYKVMAGVIFSSLHGAFIVAKTVRSPAPIEDFKSLLFSRLLV